MPDLATVREEAIAAARELPSEGMLVGKDRTGWRLEITDEQGMPILVFPFSEAIRESGG